MTLHMQDCSLRGCIRPLAPAKAVFYFQNNQDRLNDPKGNEIYWTEKKKTQLQI